MPITIRIASSSDARQMSELLNQIISAGSTFTATGVIGYEFGGYELWPTQLSVMIPAPLPLAVSPRELGESTVGSLNLFRLFEGQANYHHRLAKFAGHILTVLDAPDILAVSDSEDLLDGRESRLREPLRIVVVELL